MLKAVKHNTSAVAAADHPAGVSRAQAQRQLLTLKNVLWSQLDLLAAAPLQLGMLVTNLSHGLLEKSANDSGCPVQPSDPAKLRLAET
jgi:hypothetical protein